MFWFQIFFLSKVGIFGTYFLTYYTTRKKTITHQVFKCACTSKKPEHLYFQKKKTMCILKINLKVALLNEGKL